MRSFTYSLYILIFSALAAATTYCNSSSSCPKSEPCCSQYGECGTGSYCLGGCNPKYSYSNDACMPMPICQNLTTDFTSTDQFMTQDDYLGDAGETDWVYSGYVLDYDGAVILAMPNQTSGTVVSSTRYVWYGKISTTFKTSHDAGVVSAFILFSNAEDEIDYEFVGYELTKAETNFYYEGVLNYTNRIDANVTDTFENSHTYEVIWEEDRLEWVIDGESVRVLDREDTWNETTNSYNFPQTPSRIQVSLWPAGDESNGVGTIEWAGGEIDWDSDDIKDYGYYYAILESISVECYDPPSDTLISGSNAYVYNSSDSFLSSDVMITDDDTVLESSDDTGLNSEHGSSSSSKHSTKSSSSSHSSASESSSSESSRSNSTTGSSTISSTVSTTGTSSITGKSSTAGSTGTTSGTSTANSQENQTSAYDAKTSSTSLENGGFVQFASSSDSSSASVSSISSSSSSSSSSSLRLEISLSTLIFSILYTLYIL